MNTRTAVNSSDRIQPVSIRVWPGVRSGHSACPASTCNTARPGWLKHWVMACCVCVWGGSVAAFGAPANDAWANATVVSGTVVSFSGTNVDATAQAGEPDHAGRVARHSVWWRWTAPVTANVSLDTAGSELRTTLAVYGGTSLDTLTVVAEDRSSGWDGRSAVAFRAPAGTTYWIAVDTLGGPSGAIELHLDAVAYEVSTLAGAAGEIGSSDGPGADARFSGPQGMIVDAAGNLYVADYYDSTIRRITPDGTVTTFAGVAGESGWVDGPRAESRFANPIGLALGPDGSIYVADTNTGIRRIRPDDVVETVYNEAVSAIAVGADGTLYINSAGIAIISPSGERTQIPVESYVNALVLDADGNLYFNSGTTLQRRAPDGTITTVAGSPYPQQDPFRDGNAREVPMVEPRALAIDAAGNLYLVQSSDVELVRKISPAGVVTTIAGGRPYPGYRDGQGWEAEFYLVYGVAVDGDGNVYVADQGNHVIRKLTPVISGSPPVPLPAPANDSFADAIWLGGAPHRQVGTNLNATVEPGEGAHAGVEGGKSVWWSWVARANRRLIVDTYGSDFDTTLAVYAGNALGSLTTIASDRLSGTGGASALVFDAIAGTTYWIAVDGVDGASGRIVLNLDIAKDTHQWFTLAGSPEVPGSADGQVQQARFRFPMRMAIAPDGTLYVTDPGNHTIRRIGVDRQVTTLAGSPGQSGFCDGKGSNARFNSPAGIARDAAGNLYVADTNNHAVRKITPDGNVTTYVGCHEGYLDAAGLQARFKEPQDVVVDSVGNLFVVDTGNNVVRKVTPARVVSTFAGTAGAYGDADGVGAAARFWGVSGIDVDRDDNLYVADYIGYRIRKITPTGRVTSLAGFHSGGTGGGGHLGSGSRDGIGTDARFESPVEVAVDTRGVVYVVDLWNNGIRAISPSGVVTTVGGGPDPDGWLTPGHEDGLGVAARFATPVGIAVRGSGNLYVANTNNHTIRWSARNGFPPPLPIGIEADPEPVSTAAGGSATFSVTGEPWYIEFSYQWQIKEPGSDIWIDLTDDARFSGTTTTTLVVQSAPELDGAQFRALLRNPDSGSVFSGAATLHVTEALALVNLSIRAETAPEADVLVQGFVVSGVGSKRLLVRAVGPGLEPFGVAGTLPQPVVRLHRRTSTGWQSVVCDNAWCADGDMDGMSRVAAAVGAFPLERGSHDAAMLLDLVPGVYTLHGSDVSGKSGVMLFELYDADLGGNPRAHLVNLSARGRLGSGNRTMVAGFVVSGDVAQRLLVRAVGPSLAPLGIAGGVTDPALTVYRRTQGDDEAIAANDDWSREPHFETTADVGARLGAYALPPGSRDAAIVLTVPPGVYSIHGVSTDGSEGILLLEVYLDPHAR